MFFRRHKKETETVEREARPHLWSPAQFAALAIGVASIVLGAAALVETGLSTSHLYEPFERVWTFGHTPLLAITELGFGVLMLITALRPVAGRAVMSLLTAGALGFGIVILADAWPRRLHDWFGVEHRNGWLYVIVGGAGLAFAIFAPTFVHRGQMVVRREPVGDDEEDRELVDAER
jgi:multisubunit Na+/H+ antiporter MnhB subunit